MTTMETTNDTKRPLPEGWRWVRLGEVATYWNGRAFKPDEWREEGTPIIRIENLNSAQTTFNYFQGEARPQNCINNGDLLVSWSASLDAYIWDRGTAVLNQHIFKVDEDNSIVLRDFFYYMLRHIMTSIRGRVHGATMQHITKPEFEKIEIPLPPLDKQRRIAEMLREQVAAVEKARAAAQARLEAIKTLPAAFLRQVFHEAGQPLPDGWRWTKLGEVCNINPRRNGLTRPDTEPTSFVPMEVVDAEKGVIYEVRERPFADVKKGYTYFEEGDVLFAKITPCMQNGKHAIARNLIAGIGFASTEFHVIRPAKGILAEWAHYFVRQPAVLHDATNHFTGAVGQQRVPDNFMKSIEIPLPPLSEQRRIEEMLREQMAAVEKARAAADEELKTINALPAALLRRAFSGEL